MDKRVQGYEITVQLELRDKGDYKLLRSMVQTSIEEMIEKIPMGACLNYVAIGKITDGKYD